VHGIQRCGRVSDIEVKVCKSYEDPRKSDNILKIQNQLDETKDVMIQNIESILARGETIQELVDKTDDLEMSSKVFFQNADKLNSCWGRCAIL
jgi:synaptobrevin family protein YKT6